MSKAAPKKIIQKTTQKPAAHKPNSKHVGKDAPGSKRKALPTLPQHQYPAPYDRLLTMGEVDEEMYRRFAEELLRLNPQEATARLTAVALDRSYEEYFSETNPNMNDPRTWTRVNAIGTLTYMGDASQAAIEPLLTLLDEDDDWVREELPLFYAQMGQPAVEPLRRILQNAELETYLRAGAGDSLEQMAEQHPELRPTIVPLLEQTLIDAGEDDLLASFLVCNLLDLNAKESLPLIQQAFAEDRVDRSIVAMTDVEEHFGLAGEDKEKEKRRKGEKEPEETATGEENIRHREAVEQDRFAAPAPYVKPVKLGRNDPCWCGSGKKFKQCHGG